MPIRSRVARVRENVAPGTGTRGTLVGSREITAAEQLAADLEIAVGSRVLAFDNLRLLVNEPVSLATHHFPIPRFAGLQDMFAATGSVTQALTCAGIGDYLRQLTRVSARGVTPDEAYLLCTQPQAPVLVVESINATPGGTPIEYGVSRSIGADSN